MGGLEKIRCLRARCALRISECSDRDVCGLEFEVVKLKLKAVIDEVRVLDGDKWIGIRTDPSSPPRSPEKGSISSPSRRASLRNPILSPSSARPKRQKSTKKPKIHWHPAQVKNSKNTTRQSHPRSLTLSPPSSASAITRRRNAASPRLAMTITVTFLVLGSRDGYYHLNLPLHHRLASKIDLARKIYQCSRSIAFPIYTLQRVFCSSGRSSVSRAGGNLENRREGSWI